MTEIENIDLLKNILNAEIDEIKISHEALNRNGFSLGALYAAKWIKGNKGIHHFADILSLQLS